MKTPLATFEPAVRDAENSWIPWGQNATIRVPADPSAQRMARMRTRDGAFESTYRNDVSRGSGAVSGSDPVGGRGLRRRPAPGGEPSPVRAAPLDGGRHRFPSGCAERHGEGRSCPHRYELKL